MAELNELKTRIESIKSTQKITRAMYLISASKSRKARAQLESTLTYFRHITVTLSEILAASRSFYTPYIDKPLSSGDKILYLVLSGDKGMAGGYNHNILKLLDEQIDKPSSVLWVAGSMGRSEIIRKGYAVDQDFRYPVMNPSVYRAREIAEMAVEKYLRDEYKEIHVVYTAMITPLKQEPLIAQLLPLRPEELLDPHDVPDRMKLVKYEPSPQAVFDHLVPFYLKGILYGAFVEAYTSELHARRFAMDNASKNADEMIGRLSLRYNRARQALITQEISEIVSGIPDK